MTAVALNDLNKAGGNLAEAKKPKRGLLEMLSDPRVKTGIASVVGNAMKPERMLQLCLAAAKGNPKLLQCSPTSVLGAMMSAAALGLEPNTPQQQAFLIPYAKRGKLADGTWGVVGYECQFQIGYRGYITLAHRSPQIDYLQAECIHENDVFEHIIGTNTVFKYQKKLANRGPAIGAFAYVKFKNGTEAACVLPLDELEKIRECSDTYTSLRDKVQNARNDNERSKAKKKLDETPWVMWFDDMAAKSAIKKLAKQLPLEQGSVLSAAQQLDTAGESGRVIDMEKMTEPSTVLSIVQDGFAPPEIDASEGEFVEASDDDESAPPVAEAPAAAPIEGEFMAAAPAPDSEQEAPPVTLIGLITRASKATDTDDLMSILADGEALPSTDQKKLQRAINGRRAELESGGQMSLG